ncbi:MAG: toxin-antitoxin system YwqK family antitoxin [Candidatus Sericytochromatia bacterium]
MERVNGDELSMSSDYVYSWRGRPFSGIGYEKDSQGRLVGEITYLDGAQHGPTRIWFPESGELRSETHYRHNSRHGLQREWYKGSEGEALKSETEYEYGIVVRSRSWDLDGELAEDYVLTPDNPQYQTLELLRQRHAAD